MISSSSSPSYYRKKSWKIKKKIRKLNLRIYIEIKLFYQEYLSQFLRFSLFNPFFVLHASLHAVSLNSSGFFFSAASVFLFLSSQVLLGQCLIIRRSLLTISCWSRSRLPNFRLSQSFSLAHEFSCKSQKCLLDSIGCLSGSFEEIHVFRFSVLLSSLCADLFV